MGNAVDREEAATLDHSENGVLDDREAVETSESSSFSAPDLPNDDSESIDSQPPLAPSEVFVGGDYCYFETATSGPFQIRRIDEFVKNTVTGAVDAKVFVYSRKSDLPGSAQKLLSGFVDGDDVVPEEACRDDGDAPLEVDAKEDLWNEHAVLSRELFLNKDRSGPKTETLPSSLIRGRCYVIHHVEGISLDVYTRDEDTFFHRSTWYQASGSSQGEVITENEKHIRYDSKNTYQAVFPELLTESSKVAYDTSQEDKSDLVWVPGRLPEEDVTNFGQLAVAVGLMARSADDISSSQSSYTMARVAGRDATQTFAYDIIHRNGYDLQEAVSELVQNGLSTKRNILESFDENDMTFFQAGLHDSVRDLKKIYQEWLPWKPFGDILSFYYHFKSSSYYRHFRQAKEKKNAAQNLIKSVSILLYEEDTSIDFIEQEPREPNCYSCFARLDKWHRWTGLYSKCQHPVCPFCWHAWKRYGCLQRPWRRPVGYRRRMLVATPPVSHRNSNSNDFSCLSPRAGGSSSRFRLTNRSLNSSTTSSPSEPSRPGRLDPKKGKAREFQFCSDNDWKLVRRVASEALYSPYTVAKFPMQAPASMDQAKEYTQMRPGFVVSHYKELSGGQGKSGKRKLNTDLISKIAKCRRK
ncbi:hypothetical protein RvY_08625 [Ramazzottius varieornatus]|uniref:Uncharacterized protein n=1 Tax=Ramazzottius varieornatus TaxID=947166 RepID=A0A1D1V6K0_RAMVA|nr:hypothetical protein RvY_08625 [Ramazzottius varieornatus]